MPCDNTCLLSQYYKLLSVRPQGVYEDCVGNVTNQPATGSWHVLSNIHVNNWRRKKWDGHLRWSLQWRRCPDCVEGSFGRGNDATKWSRAARDVRDDDETGIEFCCRDKGEGACNAEPTCTREEGNKVRGRIVTGNKVRGSCQKHPI